MEVQWPAVVAIVAVFGVASAVATAFIQIGKLWKVVEDTAVNVAAQAGKFTLLQADVSDHKVEVARNYATNADVERAIDRVERAIERLGDSFRASAEKR